MRAARLRVVAADYRVAAAVADRLPSLRLSGSYGFQSNDIGELFKSPVWSLAASILAPLFLWAAASPAEVDRNEAAVREQTWQYGQTLLTAIVEVENALVQERQQAVYIELLENQLAIANDTLSAARERYREGIEEQGFLQVLTSLQAQQRSELALLQAKRRRLSFRIQLHRALGGDWTLEIKKRKRVFSEQKHFASRSPSSSSPAGVCPLSFFLVSSKPEAVVAPRSESGAVVEVVEVQTSEESVSVVARGTVLPARQVALGPEVGGKIRWISEDAIPGGRFAKGDLLVRIDPNEYRLAVEQQFAAVDSAQTQLEIEESRKKNRRARVGNFSRSRAKRARARRSRSASLKFGAPKVNLKAAESGLARAKLNVSRTQIRAPFNAMIQQRSADVGQMVAPGTPLLTLVGTDAAWVQISVPVERLAWIDVPGVGGTASSPVTVSPEKSATRRWSATARCCGSSPMSTPPGAWRVCSSRSATPSPSLPIGAAMRRRRASCRSSSAAMSRSRSPGDRHPMSSRFRASRSGRATASISWATTRPWSSARSETRSSGAARRASF